MNADQSVTATFTFPDFSVSADTATPASVTAGHSSTSTVSVTSVDGFHDAVQFQCSVDPVSTLAPACSFAPPSATPAANGSISSALTVSTTAPTGALVGPTAHGWLYAIWLPMAGLAWLGIGSFLKPPRNKMLAASLLCSLLIAGVVFQASCGGQTGPKVHQTGGTPPGAYTITIIGTSGSTQHSTNVTLIVQ